MKQQLKNKLLKGYTIKIYNNIYKNNEYLNNEYLKINFNSVIFKDSTEEIYNIKGEPEKILYNIIENTFFNINHFKMVFYRDYKVKKIIRIIYNSNI